MIIGHAEGDQAVSIARDQGHDPLRRVHEDQRAAGRRRYGDSLALPGDVVAESFEQLLEFIAAAVDVTDDVERASEIAAIEGWPRARHA